MGTQQVECFPLGLWQVDLTRLEPHGELVLVYNDHVGPNKVPPLALSPSRGSRPTLSSNLHLGISGYHAGVTTVLTVAG